MVLLVEEESAMNPLLSPRQRQRRHDNDGSKLTLAAKWRGGQEAVMAYSTRYCTIRLHVRTLLRARTTTFDHSRVRYPLEPAEDLHQDLTPPSLQTQSPRSSDCRWTSRPYDQASDEEHPLRRHLDMLSPSVASHPGRKASEHCKKLT
jgi:hypothetical protein